VSDFSIDGIGTNNHSKHPIVPQHFAPAGSAASPTESKHDREAADAAGILVVLSREAWARM
jgi:hypothetical protein